jgi:hypothetical protein
MKLCGAKTRGGGRCKKPAMPNGRCKLHGGKTPSGTDSVHFKHGLYSNAFKGRLAERFAQAEAEETPLDLLPELRIQRAMLAERIEQVSGGRDPKPDELKSITLLADAVVRTAATIAKVRNDTALTIAEVKFIQIGMIRLIEKYVPDTNRRRDFIRELRALVPGRADASADESEGVPAFAETTGESAGGVRVQLSGGGGAGVQRADGSDVESDWNLVTI